MQCVGLVDCDLDGVKVPMHAGMAVDADDSVQNRVAESVKKYCIHFCLLIILIVFLRLQQN